MLFTYVHSNFACIITKCNVFMPKTQIMLMVLLILPYFETVQALVLLIKINNSKANVICGSCMRAYLLLNFLTELGKEIKYEACRAFYLISTTSLLNSTVQQHKC